MPRRGHFVSHRVVRGEECKFCGRCGEWLPLFRFHPKRGGGYHTPCKRCRSMVYSKSPLVAFKPRYHSMLVALVNRVGKAEAARIMGISKSRVSHLLGDKAPMRVQRDTAKAILLSYRAAIRSGVVLSRNSIKHGAFERGKPVRMAEKRDDLYSPWSAEGGN